MTSQEPPLTGESSIGAWLDHPVGGPIVRDLLATAGQDPAVLRPVHRLPISRLVTMSQGSFTQDMLDELVRRAAAGEVPAATEAPSEAPTGPAPAVERPEWTERITPERFTGMTVIVTGAGSGIGRATASRIVREGGRVVAVDVSAARLAALTEEFTGADLVTVAGDITDQESISRIVAAAGERIDGLANVAGIMDDMTPVHEVSDDVWHRVFSVNVDGTMRLMRAVVPAMLARGRGSIVNVASEAALRGSAAGATYTASKHAVVGLTRSSAFMYGPSGIRVNAVAPGPVLTNIEARFASELGAQRVRSGLAIMPEPVEADALAASITFLLSDDGVNVNGAVLPSDGGWSAG